MKPALLAASLVPLAALSAPACSSAVRSQPGVVARSRLGSVTADELDRYIATRGPVEADASHRRQRLEELLALRAAEQEGSGLLAQPEVAAALQRRLDEVLLAEARRRFEAEAEAAADAVTPAAVDAAYAAAPDPAAVERIRLRHIFKRVSRNADPDERNRAEQAMEQIVRELDAGADFGALARTRSDSQTASFDGLMAPVARGDLDATLERILWTLAPGERTGVVRTSAGLQVFRLEGRETKPVLGIEDAKKGIRSRLAREARAAFVEKRLSEMAQARGVVVRLERLDDPNAPDDTVAAEWPGEVPVTVGELFRSWSALPFPARRTSDLRQVLEETMSRRLLLDAARRERLDERPEVAATLGEARRAFLAGAAQERRAEALTAAVGDEELRRLHEAERQRFERPEARRLRGILVRVPDPRQANAAFDPLDGVARELRAGVRDLAATARAMSHDPSRRDGGDLGWAEAQPLAVWAGPRVPAAVMAAPSGELLGPLLVESYDSHRLVYVPAAYLLVRVEDVRAAGPAPFAEVRPELLRLYRARHSADIGRRMRADLLASIEAVLVDRP